MNHKIIILIVSFVLISNSSLCQNGFRKGYIITHEKDTIVGHLDYRSNTNNYKSCIFKNKQEEREYYPDEIIGFGYYNDKHFSSEIVEGFFVEVLVLGKISLFKSKNKYHLKKDTSVYDLESFSEEVEIDGKIGTLENNRWRGIISYLTSDCIISPKINYNSIKLNEKNITKLIVKYNKCKGSDFLEIKVSKPWIKYELGATVSISKSEIQITSLSGFIAYMDKSYSFIGPSVGINMGISAPRKSEKIAFQSEIHFFKSSYSSFVILDNSSIEYHDTFINLSTFSVPLSFKYSFSEKKYGLYLQGGINYDYHLIGKSKLLSEIVIGNIVNTLPERSAFEINKNQIGYWGGVGISKSFQKFKASIAIRYFQMPALNKTGSFTANNSRILLNLILLKK